MKIEYTYKLERGIKMKKIWIFIVCSLLLASLQAIGDANDTNCINSEKHQTESTCPQTRETNKCNKFLCTDSDMETIFDEIGLSDSQICTTMKIQEKYEQETISVNDRLLYEENVLNEYIATCADNRDKRNQKKKIKNLKKTRDEICKCYEQQFKTILSKGQKSAYSKYKVH